MNARSGIIRQVAAATVLALVAFASTGLAVTDDPAIRWHSIDGGGATSVSGTIKLVGTIGQPDAGSMSAGALTLTGGFWFGTPPGDCNATGSVNALDHAAFVPCMNGPNGSPGSDCSCVDLDGDEDVDLSDFAGLQQVYDGT